jgi:hypothetical protein
VRKSPQSFGHLIWRAVLTFRNAIQLQRVSISSVPVDSSFLTFPL